MKKKMKCRMGSVILAIILVLAQAMGVAAAGSRTAKVEPAGESVGKYQVSEASPEKLTYLEESAPEVFDLIIQVNKGTKDLKDIAEAAPELAEQLADKSLVTDIFELEPIDGGIKTEDGKFLVTLSVPELTEALTDVALLHYSTVRSLWEIVTPTNVDYTNKQITAELEDLSPVAVIAKVDESKLTDNGGKGTSPQTGVASVWGYYMGAAVILLMVGVGIIIRSRKRECRR